MRIISLLLLLSFFCGCAMPPVSSKTEPPPPVPFIISDPARANYLKRYLLLLESDISSVRENAIVQLKEVNLPPYYSNLLKDMGNPDLRIAEAARRTLVREGKTMNALAKFSTDSLAEWNNARKELSDLGSEALLAMVQVLSYKFLANNERYTEWGREQIRASGAPIIKPVQQVLRYTREVEVSHQLTLALVEMGRVAEEFVTESITSDNLHRALDVITALGESGLEYWIDKLGGLLLKDNRWQVRAQAAEALGKIPSERSSKLLIDGLNDPDILVKETCVKALDYLKEIEAVPYLINLLDMKDNPNLVNSTILALIRITGKRFGGKSEVWRRWWQEIHK